MASRTADAMTVASFWGAPSSEVKITTRLRGSAWSGRSGRGIGRINGGEWWEQNHKTLAGRLPTLAIDYLNDRYMANGVATTFANLHTFGRSSLATFIDNAGIIQTASNDEARLSRDGIVLENSGTNDLVRSNALSTSPWVVSGATAPMSSSITGPDGVATSAWLLVDDGSDDPNANVLLEHSTLTVSTSTAYTYSVYAKEKDASFLIIRTRQFTTPGNVNTTFNLTTGVVASEGAGHTAIILDVGNGWFRCSITFTTDSSDTAGSVRVHVTDTVGVLNVPLDGTTSIHIFGLQFEKGNFPSSYIATTAVPVTRLPDDAEIDPTKWSYSNTTGTFIAHAKHRTAQGKLINNNTIGDQGALIWNNASFLRGRTENGTTGITVIKSSGKTNDGAIHKMGVAYSANGRRLGLDDTQITDEEGTFLDTTPTSFFLGSRGAGNSPMDGEIDTILWYPFELSQSDLTGALAA